MALINTTTTGVLGSTFFGDGTGDLTIQQNGVTINKITAAPAFSAARTGSDQTISSLTWTKVQFNTKAFDTNNNYDNATNYRFTPTVAGYYQFNALVYFGGSGINAFCQLYKNGGGIQYGSSTPTGGGASGQLQVVSSLAYANGTTDYFEIYAYSGGTNITGGTTISHFSAFLARAA
jgi:hypothetical protein